MSEKPNIDILMATYNGEKYLEEQLESILSQTYNNFRLLISDDHSTDRTWEILNSYAKKDKRIKIYKQEKNIGYRKNFEYLSSLATLEYSMFSDQDDIWNKNKIKKMLDFQKANNSVIVYSDLKIVDEKLNEISNSIIRTNYLYERCLNYKNIWLIHLDNVANGCAMLVKTEVLEKALPYPQKTYPHDWWIMLVGSQMGSIDFLDEPLVLYRQHGQNQIGASNASLKSKITFDNYRSNLIKNKKEEFLIREERKDLFLPWYQEEIQIGSNYFLQLEKKAKLKNVPCLWKVYKKEKLSRKIKACLLFHFPIISKTLYMMRNCRKKRRSNV